MPGQKYARKRYLVLKGFQLKYVGSILLFMFAIALLSGYTVYYTTWILLGERLAGVYPQGRLVYILQRANIVLLLRILFITPLVALIGLMLSHRIAGPMYRIERFLREIPEGNYSQRIYLRKRDSLKPLADGINNMLTQLENQRDKERQAVVTAREKLSELKSELEKPSPSINSLKENVDKISEELTLLK